MPERLGKTEKRSGNILRIIKAQKRISPEAETGENHLEFTDAILDALLVENTSCKAQVYLKDRHMLVTVDSLPAKQTTGNSDIVLFGFVSLKKKRDAQQLGTFMIEGRRNEEGGSYKTTGIRFNINLEKLSRKDMLDYVARLVIGNCLKQNNK